MNKIREEKRREKKKCHRVNMSKRDFKYIIYRNCPQNLTPSYRLENNDSKKTVLLID